MDVPRLCLHIRTWNMDVPSLCLDVWTLNMDVPSLCLHIRTWNMDVASSCLDVWTLNMDVQTFCLDVRSSRGQFDRPHGRPGRADCPVSRHVVPFWFRPYFVPAGTIFGRPPRDP